MGAGLDHLQVYTLTAPARPEAQQQWRHRCNSAEAGPGSGACANCAAEPHLVLQAPSISTAFPFGFALHEDGRVCQVGRGRGVHSKHTRPAKHTRQGSTMLLCPTQLADAH